MNTHSTFGKKKGVALSLACIGLLASAPAAYAGSSIFAGDGTENKGRTYTTDGANDSVVKITIADDPATADKLMVSEDFSGSITVDPNNTLDILTFSQSAKSSGANVLNNGAINEIKGQVGVVSGSTFSIINNNTIDDANLRLDNIAGTVTVNNAANARFGSGMTLNNTGKIVSGGSLNVSNYSNFNGLYIQALIENDKNASQASVNIENRSNLGGIFGIGSGKLSAIAKSGSAVINITNEAGANFGGIDGIAIEVKQEANNASGAFTIANSGNFGNVLLNSIALETANKGGVSLNINNTDNFGNLTVDRDVSLSTGSGSAIFSINNAGTFGNINLSSLTANTKGIGTAGNGISGAHTYINNQKTMGNISLGNVTLNSGGAVVVIQNSGAGSVMGNLSIDELKVAHGGTIINTGLFVVNDNQMGDITISGKTTLGGGSGAALGITGEKFGNINIGDIEMNVAANGGFDDAPVAGSGGFATIDIKNQAGTINIGEISTKGFVSKSGATNHFTLNVADTANVGPITLAGVKMVSGGNVIANINGNVAGDIIVGSIDLDGKAYSGSTKGVSSNFALNFDKTSGSNGVFGGNVNLGSVSIASGGAAKINLTNTFNILGGIKVGDIAVNAQSGADVANYGESEFSINIGDRSTIGNGIQLGNITLSSNNISSGGKAIASINNQGTIYGGVKVGDIAISGKSTASGSTIFSFANSGSRTSLDTLTIGNITFRDPGHGAANSDLAYIFNEGSINEVNLNGASGAVTSGANASGLLLANTGSITAINLSGIYGVSGSGAVSHVNITNSGGTISTITIAGNAKFDGQITNAERTIDRIINQGTVSGASGVIANLDRINSIENVGYTNASGTAVGGYIQSISNLGTIATVSNSAISTINQIGVGDASESGLGGFISTIANAGTINTLVVNYSGATATDDNSTYKQRADGRDSVNGAVVKEVLNTGLISTINVGTGTDANGHIHSINNQGTISTLSVSGTSTIGTLANQFGGNITALNNSGAISTFVNNGLVGANINVWNNVQEGADETYSWKSGGAAIYVDPSQSVSISSGAKTAVLPYAIFTKNATSAGTGLSGAGSFTSFENNGTIFMQNGDGLKFNPVRVEGEIKKQAYFKNNGLIVVSNGTGPAWDATSSSYKFSGAAAYGLVGTAAGTLRVENTGKILMDSVKSAQIKAEGNIQIDRWDLTIDRSAAAFNYLGKDKTWTDAEGNSHTYNQGNLTWSGAAATDVAPERNWAYSGSNTLDLSTGTQADIQQLNAMTNSHIIVSGGTNLRNIKFGAGSIRLNLGRDFEAGKVYKLSNLVLENNDGNLTAAGNVASGSVSVASGSLVRTYGNLANTTSASQVRGVDENGNEKGGLSVYNLSTPNAMFEIKEAKWDSTQQSAVVNKNADDPNSEPEWISVDILGDVGAAYSGGETGVWQEGFVYDLNPSAGRGAETAQITLAAAQRRSSFINSVISSAINQSQASNRRFVNAELNRYALVEDANFSLSDLDHYAAPDNRMVGGRSVANSHVFVMPYYTTDEVKFDAGGKSKGNIYGLILGYQRNLGGSNGTAGVFAGYESAKNKIDAHNGWGDETQKDTTFTVGANYYTNVYESSLANVFAKGLVKVATTKSKFDNSGESANHLSWGLEAGVGANVYLNRMHTITPEVALSFDSLRVGGFDDKDLGVSYDKTNLNLLVARLGVSWTANWIEKLSTDLGVGIKYNTKKNASVDASQIGGASYSTEIKLPQTYTYVTASVAYRVAPNTDLSLTYNGDFSNKSNSHSGYLRVGYWW